MPSLYKSCLCLCLFASLAFETSTASADTEFGGGFTVGRFYGGEGTQVIVTVSPTPPKTCSYFSSQLIFDASTPHGKIMFAILLASKAMGKPIDIWYGDSTAPGTDETNGCNSGTMSVLNNVGQVK